MLVKCIIAGDSRLRDFGALPQQNSELYSTNVVILRGGALPRIIDYVCNLLKTDEFQEADLVLVYIVGGICDITRKWEHSGGIEIVPRQQINVIGKITEGRQRIIDSHPNVVVGFAQIPVVHLEKAKRHNLANELLFYPVHSEESTRNLQSFLTKKIDDINYWIGGVNKIPQLLQNFYPIKVKQLFLNCDIVKTTYTMRNGKKHNVRRQIQATQLEDGVHATYNLSAKWNDLIHNNLLMMCEDIKEMEDLPQHM